MIINDLDGCYIVFDTKNRNMELDTLFKKYPNERERSTTYLTSKQYFFFA